MLSWEDEDFDHPISPDLTDLFKTFKNVYHFDVEHWRIPIVGCHVETNQRILDFVRLGGDSEEDLKIVFYAGQSKLIKNGSIAWIRYVILPAYLDLFTLEATNTYNALEVQIHDILQYNGVEFKIHWSKHSVTCLYFLIVHILAHPTMMEVETLSSLPRQTTTLPRRKTPLLLSPKTLSSNFES